MTFNWKRYIAYYIGSLLAMIVIVQILAIFGINLQSSGLSIIPAMVAALVEGQKYAKLHQPPLAAPWKNTFAMTGIALAFNVVITSFVLASTPYIRTALMDALYLFAGTMAVYALILMGIIRLFYGMGARSVWKAAGK
ncbi:MAG: ABZJ_00895 family protein [Planktomarina sp.]